MPRRMVFKLSNAVEEQRLFNSLDVCHGRSPIKWQDKGRVVLEVAEVVVGSGPMDIATRVNITLVRRVQAVVSEHTRHARAIFPDPRTGRWIARSAQVTGAGQLGTYKALPCLSGVNPAAQPADTGDMDASPIPTNECRAIVLVGSSPPPPRSLARIIKRVIALGAGLAVFLFAASVVDPRQSPAADPLSPPMARTAAGKNTEPTRDEVQRGLLARKHPLGWPVLGLIEGVEYYLVIHGSSEGPRYTVCTLTGRVLQADLPADDVYRAFPTVDVEGMRLEPAALPLTPDGPALMLVDPRD